MSNFKEFMASPASGQPEEGDTGIESSWLKLADFTLRGRRFLIADTDFLPVEEDGVVVEAPPGRYEIQVKVMSYGQDRRISRLRCILSGSNPTRGQELGETWTDTAGTGICDLETFTPVFDAMGEDDALEKIREVAWEEPAGMIDFGGDAQIAFAHSGFGDGTYPVVELLEQGRRAGFEIEFIAADATYPFSGEEEDEEGEEDESGAKTENPFEMIGQLFQGFQEKQTGDRTKDMATLQGMFQDMFGDLVQDAGMAVQEVRAAVISSRREDFPLEMKLEADDGAWADLPDAKAAADTLRAAGFEPAGSWRVAGNEGLKTLGFIRPRDHVAASVTLMEGKPIVSLQAELTDGRVFELTQTTDPKNPLPHNFQKMHRPDWPAQKLVAEFDLLCPPGQRKPVDPSGFAEAVESEYRRYQDWFMDRGGLTEEELAGRIELPEDPEEARETLKLVRQGQADLMLYRWLRHQHGLDFDPEEKVESLYIIHEGMDPDALLQEWRASTSDLDTAGTDFEGDDPREAFAKINDREEQPLRRVLRKESGLKADFYLVRQPGE